MAEDDAAAVMGAPLRNQDEARRVVSYRLRSANRQLPDDRAFDHAAGNNAPDNLANRREHRWFGAVLEAKPVGGGQPRRSYTAQFSR